ncbi:MAG: hypothetical protein LBT53_01400 [Puniceicoccales bacterium]|jgi:hypothetical protein|nr:hypothetical protein [Puniceicoccales bacterium]
MKKHASQIIRALCACAALVYCLYTTGCLTTVTQYEIKPPAEEIVYSADFWIKEIFCPPEMTFKDLTSPNLQPSHERDYSIVLEGDWRWRRIETKNKEIKDKEIKHGYIVITEAKWLQYLAHCGKNNLKPTPEGALKYKEYTGDDKRAFSQIYDNYGDLRSAAADRARWNRITEECPQTSAPIVVQWCGDFSTPFNPFAIPLMLVTVPLDIVTSPIQLVMAACYFLNGGDLP